MDAFEYVVVLTSLILGLGIAQILTSLADILSNIRQVKLCLPHSFLTITVFLLHIQEWWINYQYSHEISVWRLPIVLSILIYPILLFILARMLFPTGIRGHETNLEDYYYDQWPWFFGIALGTLAISIWQNLFIQGLPLLNSWPQLVFGVIYGLFFLFRIKHRLLHNLVQGIWLLGLIIYMVTDHTTIE